MPHKISIIVPVYNQAEYLDECLQSVADQSYTDWECIIVDDGSPDNTGQVAKKWVEQDPRFMYFRKQNGGVASARNFGIAKSVGNWILPLDGDDKIGPEYLQAASGQFQADPDIIYCRAKYFGLRNDEFLLEDFNVAKMLLENQIFCTAIFKREVWKTVGGFDESMQKGYEDWDFWLAVIALKEEKIKVIRLDYTGFFYRIKEVSRNTEAMKANDEAIRKYLYKKYQDLYIENITAFKNILHKNRRLKEKNNNLEKVISSRKYRFISKILNIFKL